jgi:hypothetical protein
VKRDLSFYEFAGIVAPGLVLLLGIAVLTSDAPSFQQIAKFDLGGLGLLLVLSYVAGHLVQAIGNVLERVYWSWWGGMPTDWVRNGK